MSKISLIVTLFAIGIILLFIITSGLVDPSQYSVPEIDSEVVQDLNPTLNQTFLTDLQERSSNAVGIELEL